jgi:opacity protein-like surface antigen
MKKFTFLFLISCIAAGARQASAQTKVHIGLNTAFNSTFVLDKGLSEDPRYKAEPTYKFSPIGLAFGADFGRGFGLQLESILSKQGQVYEIMDVAKKSIGERRIDLTYVHLPLLLRTFSTGTSRTRFNFMFGPQFSILTKGVEVYEQNQNGTLELPEGAQAPTNPNTGEQVTVKSDRTYDYPASTQIIASTEAKKSIDQFKKNDLQLALGIGVDIDLGSNLYLSSQIRGNYGFMDMRNEDLITSLKDNKSQQVVKDLFGRRANVVVGLQLGLHWVFGGNHSSSASEAGIPDR